jgi:4'-phosphopantetheinyl transferase
MSPEPSPFGVEEGTQVSRLGLQREDWQGEAALSALPAVAFAEWEPRAGSVLSGPEMTCFNRALAQRRRESFLLGRVAARMALAELGAIPPSTEWRGWHGAEVVPGVFQQPVLGAGIAPGHGVSIGHSAGLALAVAFPAGHPMAVDVETVSDDREAAVTTLLTPEEKAMARGAGRCETGMHFALWSTREALSKVLHCGLVCSPHVLAVKELAVDGERFEGTFRHFPQYRFVGKLADALVRCLVLPRKTVLAAVPRKGPHPGSASP